MNYKANIGYRLRPKPGLSVVSRQVFNPVAPPKPQYMPKVAQAKHVKAIPIIKSAPTKSASQPKKTEQPKHQNKQIFLREKLNKNVVKTKNFADRNVKKQSYLDPHLKRIENVGTGRVLVIIACGPSIKEIQLEELNGLRNVDICCINKPDTRIVRPTYWGFCDSSQHSRNKALFESFTGIIINPTSIRPRRDNQILVQVKQGSGFSKDLTTGYYIGRSSTYAMMQVAYYMNYDHVFILGVDMGASADGSVWFYNVNPDVSPDERLKRFEAEAKSYNLGASILTEVERKKFTFCSSILKWDFKDKYNHIDHHQAIGAIRQYLKRYE